MDNTTYIVIPAYNEEQNIEKLINDWYPVVDSVPDVHLVVVNDGSKDGTLDLLRTLAESRPKMEVLTKENGGHGDTLIFGYQHAIDCGATWIFQTDSDGQTEAQEFQSFWDLRNQYDAIFGNRTKRGDGASRKFVENVLCTMLRVIFGVSVPDSNCPFRLMRADKVAEYLQYLPPHYFLPNVMLTVFFTKNDKVTFKEVTFADRQGGANTINAKKIIKIGWQSIGDFIGFRKYL